MKSARTTPLQTTASDTVPEEGWAPPEFTVADARGLLSLVAERTTSCGLLRDEPWATCSILPPLVRALKNASPGGGVAKRLESTVATILGGALRTAHGEGWFQQIGGRVSPEFIRLASDLMKKPAFAEWRGVVRRLWGPAGAAASGRSPETGLHDEDAGAAILRRDWSPSSSLAAVDFSGVTCGLTVRIAGADFLSGEWTTSIRADGKSIDSDHGWSSVCWFADKDGEYLELASPLKGAVLERQVFVARRCPLILLADSIRGERPAEWELTWELPLHQPSPPRGDLATRSHIFPLSDAQVAVAPLALPSNPLQACDGRTTLVNGSLVANYRCRGGGCVFPVAFTWGSEPDFRPKPWTQLSITNDRRNVPADEALAVRMGVADRHFVYFRSLRRETRQAFLGHQTFDEAVIGEFTKKGEVEPWLRIE